METKPTPGPWIVDGDTIVRAKNSQGYDRAFFSVHAGNTAPMEATTAEELHANARLIAAAPRMFAVIEKSAAAGDAECIAIVEAVNGRG